MANEQEKIDEFKRYEFLAENGHPTFQYFFASAINAKDNHPDRQIQSLKWAFLAHYFEEPQAKDIVMFLRHSMTDTDIEVSYQLAERWLTEKFDISKEEEKANWSQTLRKLTSGKRQTIDRV